MQVNPAKLIARTLPAISKKTFWQLVETRHIRLLENFSTLSTWKEVDIFLDKSRKIIRNKTWLFGLWIFSERWGNPLNSSGIWKIKKLALWLLEKWKAKCLELKTGILTVESWMFQDKLPGYENLNWPESKKNRIWECVLLYEF